MAKHYCLSIAPAGIRPHRAGGQGEMDAVDEMEARCRCWDADQKLRERMMHGQRRDCDWSPFNAGGVVEVSRRSDNGNGSGSGSSEVRAIERAILQLASDVLAAAEAEAEAEADAEAEAEAKAETETETETQAERGTGAGHSGAASEAGARGAADTEVARRRNVAGAASLPPEHWRRRQRQRAQMPWYSRLLRAAIAVVTRNL